MGKIIFIIIGLLILLLYNGKKKGLLNPSSFLIAIYLLSAICCVLHILINDETLVLKSKYWPAAIVFLLLITGFLAPFISVKENRWKIIKLPPLKVLYLFSDLLIVLSLFSIIYYITDVIRVFTSGDLSRMREQLTGFGGEYSNSGILNTIASVSASFYNIVLILFFIFSAMGGNKKRRVLLFLSSFSYMMQVFSFAGRDGVVFWLFSFIFDYLLFREYLPKQLQTKLTRTFIKVLIVISIPFLALSVSRFGEDDGGTGGGLVSYMGHPMYHWCLYYGMDHRIVSPGAGWPLYYEITGKKQPQSVGLWESEGTRSWVFGTFLRSWLSSIGMIGIILIMVFMWFLFYISFHKYKRRIEFHCLFIYVLFFDIIGQGVFYFLQYTRGGNLTIVLMIFFFGVFGIIDKKGHKLLIKNDCKLALRDGKRFLLMKKSRKTRIKDSSVSRTSVSLSESMSQFMPGDREPVLEGPQTL